jgi:hypothetical protein
MCSSPLDDGVSSSYMNTLVQQSKLLEITRVIAMVIYCETITVFTVAAATIFRHEFLFFTIPAAADDLSHV